VVSVGRVDKQKGFDMLLDAYVLLQAKHPNIKLDIVGGGPEKDSLQIWCKNRKLTNVTFHGFQKPQAIAELLNKAGVFALASRAESFGMVAAEAAACGLPVVATKVGGLPEVVEHNKSGYLVPPENPKALAEKIELLISDEKRNKKFGRKGKNRVNRRFTWKRRVKTLEAVYKKI